jgi:hypothetical protein
MVMAVPSRRTLIVLTTLIAAMTLAASLLLIFEPGSTALMGVSLSAVNPVDDHEELFDTTAPPAAGWQNIAIHFSGAAYGSVQTLAEQHQRLGLGSLGFHLVLGNGQGADDGAVEIGPRWRHQQPGLSNQLSLNRGHGQTIDIGLIGDGNRAPLTDAQLQALVHVTQQLQARFHIAPERVLIYTDPASGRGQRFPLAWFRQQLLSAR